MKGWKTVLLAALSFAIYGLGWEQLTQYVDPQLIAMIGAILMLLMRLVSDTAPFKRG